MSAYEDQRKKEREFTRQIALNDARKWLKKIPAKQRKKPQIVVGTRVFTAEQLVKEAEVGTEYGNEFLEMIHNSKLELLKGRKK